MQVRQAIQGAGEAGRQTPEMPRVWRYVGGATLEQAATLTAYVEGKEQEREWRTLRLTVMLGLTGLLLLFGLVFRPSFYLVVSALAIAGTIGNIWLIVHAFRNDDVTSGIVMVLSFVFPLLWLYTLYYLVKRWDGTAPFLLTAGAICGLGTLLIISLFILTASLIAARSRQPERQQFLDLAKFGLAVYYVYDDRQRPDSDLIKKKLEDKGLMTAEQYQQFLQDYEIRWDVILRGRNFVKNKSAVVIAYHRASFANKQDTVATGFLDGHVHHLPCDELARILKP